MKNLFKNRFPYVGLPNDQLNDEQLAIKKIYNEMDTDVPCAPCEAEKAKRMATIQIKPSENDFKLPKEMEDLPSYDVNRLRKVRVDEPTARE